MPTVYSLVFHLLQDGDDHVKAGPLAWFLVHADLDESGHVRSDAGWDADAEAFQRHLGIHTGNDIRNVLNKQCFFVLFFFNLVF